MSPNYISIFLGVFLINLAVTGLLRKLSLKYNFLSHKGIPLVGGLGIGFSFLFSCFLLPFIPEAVLPDMRIVLVPLLIMLISGIIDDWLELSVLIKFLAQILAVSILIFLGVKTRIAFIGSAANIIITLVWVIGITNAFNLLDVLDALAAGIAIIISLAFFAVSVLNGDIKSATLSLVIFASSISFLVYNLPPAKIYLGNCGSHYLGFLFAVIAMTISYATLERKAALVSPLLILWFPIFDTAFLILMRMLKGRSMFKKSNDHFAFRLLKSGYSRTRALFFMFFLALLFSACGVLLSQVSNKYGVTIIAIIFLITLGITGKISRVKVDE